MKKINSDAIVYCNGKHHVIKLKRVDACQSAHLSSSSFILPLQINNGNWLKKSGKLFSFVTNLYSLKDGVFSLQLLLRVRLYGYFECDTYTLSTFSFFLVNDIDSSFSAGLLTKQL